MGGCWLNPGKSSQLPNMENVLDSRQNHEVAGKNGVVGLRRATMRLWCVYCTLQSTNLKSQ
jgi:hypothetical protein